MAVADKDAGVDQASERGPASATLSRRFFSASATTCSLTAPSINVRSDIRRATVLAERSDGEAVGVGVLLVRFHAPTRSLRDVPTGQTDASDAASSSR